MGQTRARIRKEKDVSLSSSEFFLDRMDSLVNDGTGVNYGIELTIEKFMNRNYFFLVTASLFNSK